MIGDDTRSFTAQHGTIHGDLSRQDTIVLADYVRRASSIVEAGVGGSTFEIHRNVNNAAAEILHLETNPDWIKQVKRGIAQFITRPHPHQFIQIPEDIATCRHELTRYFGEQRKLYDLVFIDAIYYYREIVAATIWPHVAIGGKLLVHDTRQQDARQFLFPFIDENFNSIEMIRPNYLYSNITVIEKGITRNYENWNHTETLNNRKGWDY